MAEKKICSSNFLRDGEGRGRGRGREEEEREREKGRNLPYFLQPSNSHETQKQSANFPSCCRP